MQGDRKFPRALCVHRDNAVASRVAHVKLGIVGRIGKESVAVRHEIIRNRGIGFFLLLGIPVYAIGIQCLSVLI
jgi:hypothetical protein